MDSNTAVMTRDYGSSKMSEIPLSSSVECIRESSRIDNNVRLKPKKNDSLPRFFRRKKSPDPAGFCMCTKEEIKPKSNSLGRRIHFRLAQLRNPHGVPVETLRTEEPVEVKKSGIRGYLSGYWSSMFKKTPRDSDISEPVTPSIVMPDGDAMESRESMVETIQKTTIDIAQELPKAFLDEDVLEKTVKSTTQEVYVG